MPKVFEFKPLSFSFDNAEFVDDFLNNNSVQARLPIFETLYDLNEEEKKMLVAPLHERERESVRGSWECNLFPRICKDAWGYVESKEFEYCELNDISYETPFYDFGNVHYGMYVLCNRIYEMRNVLPQDTMFIFRYPTSYARKIAEYRKMKLLLHSEIGDDVEYLHYKVLQTLIKQSKNHRELEEKIFAIRNTDVKSFFTEDTDEAGGNTPLTMDDLKRYREEHNLSPKDFANMFSIPVSTYNQWESGRRNPPAYVLNMMGKITIYADGMDELVHRDTNYEVLLRNFKQHIEEYEVLYEFPADIKDKYLEYREDGTIHFVVAFDPENFDFNELQKFMDSPSEILDDRIDDYMACRMGRCNSDDTVIEDFFK